MAGRALPIEEILALLRTAPARIAAMTADLTEAQLRADPEPGEWSANGILAHLRCCADVWGGYIVRILAEDHPTIRAVSPRTRITRTDYPDLAFRPSLRAFTTQRIELLAVLEALASDAWLRAATVTGGGRTIERTVQSYADALAVHERSHLEQIDRTVRAVQL